MRNCRFLAGAAVGGAVLIVLSATPGQAQPGSRLCGWVSTNTDDKLAFLVEKPREAKKSCRDRIDRIKRVLDQHKGWSGRNKAADRFVWQRIERVECERIGAMGFALDDGGTDICDRMKREDYYIVSRLKKGRSAFATGKTQFRTWGQYPRSNTSGNVYWHYRELTDKFMNTLGKPDYEVRHKRRDWDR